MWPCPRPEAAWGRRPSGPFGAVHSSDGLRRGGGASASASARWYFPRLCWVLGGTYASTVLILVSLPTFCWWSMSRTVMDEVVQTFTEAHEDFQESYREATEQLAGDIQHQITRSVRSKVRSYLDWPGRVLNMTVQADQRGVPLFSHGNVSYNLQVIWTLLRFTFPEVSNIFYGDATGAFAGYGRLNATHYQAMLRPPDMVAETPIVCPRLCPPVGELSPGRKGNYIADNVTGSFQSPAFITMPYDARKRPFYQKAVDAGGHLVVSPLHLSTTNLDWGLDFSQAVLGVGRRTTVFGVTVTLQFLAAFLQEVQHSEAGEELEDRRVTFIVDAAGMMVASSRGLQQVVMDVDGIPHQRPWNTVNDTLVRACGELPRLWGRPHLSGSGVTRSGLLYAYDGIEVGQLKWTIVSVVRLETWLDIVEAMFKSIDNDLRHGKNTLRGRLRRAFYDNIFAFAIGGLVVGLPGIMCLAQTITRPLHLICRDMKSIARLEFLDQSEARSSADEDGEEDEEQQEESSGESTTADGGGDIGLQSSIISSRRARYLKHFEIFKQPCLPIMEVSQMRDAFAAMASGLKSFSRYVDPHVMEGVVRSRQQATLSVKPTDVTIFFSDVADFTSIAESLQPEVFMELLSEYLDVMNVIIMRNGGTLGEFIGAEIMAWWNDPVELGECHTKMALEAALAQQARLAQLRAKWCEDGLPEIRARMGLVRGTVLAGNIGGKKRMKYGLVGDSVNLASRLEGLCKRYGVEIVLDGVTRTAPGVEEAFHCRPLDLVVVKGRTGITELFELVACKQDHQEASEAKLEAFVLDFAVAQTFYRQADFRSATRMLEDYRKKWPRDQPAMMLLERCEQHLASPPGEGWSPVEKLTEK